MVWPSRSLDCKDPEGSAGSGSVQGLLGVPPLALLQKVEGRPPEVPSINMGKSAPPGGLAARRKFTAGPIKVETHAENCKDSDVAPSRQHRRRRGIQLQHLCAKYEVGIEVMPSCHPGMKVLFGTQKGTGVPVVIKVREKKKSFAFAGEEKEWRCGMEFMLNLPPSGNIAKFYEVLEDATNYYVIMEECKGKDLFECIHGVHGKLNPEEVKDVLTQILNALADLHAQGIIHKDLKLENVILEGNPSPAPSFQWKSDEGSDKDSGSGSPLVAKLVDFDTVEEHIPHTPKKSRDVLGTDQYIAQEAYAGKYSFASDIFAVGVIGYRLLVGRFPFDPRLFDDEPGQNWVGSPKMKEIREKLCKYKINWSYEVFGVEPGAASLLQAMLATSESDRPTAKAAADHAWLKSTRSASNSSASTWRSGEMRKHRSKAAVVLDD